MFWRATQGMEDAHRIVQTFLFFVAVSRCVEQLPCPQHKRTFRVRAAADSLFTSDSRIATW